jgi:hypothetical protein
MILLLGCVLIVDGCQKKDAGQTLRLAAQAPETAPKVLAAYMPWFGDKSHMDVGYSSHDINILRHQIDQATSMGISGFAVDWNGTRRKYTDTSFALMEQAAKEKNFKVTLLYNESEDASQSTDQAIEDFDKAYSTYIGPDAPDHDAYLTYNGHPVIFIFPKGGHTDWNRVRQHVNRWASPPLMFQKDGAPQEMAGAFDGFYAWVHPGPKGWAPDGSDWGKQYLDNFYKKMKDQYPDKIAIAGAWAGFDDSHASWGLNRHIDNRCGKTFDDTLQIAREHPYGVTPSFLLIETWNDYEEGTAVERLAFKGCQNSNSTGQKGQ